MQQIDSQTIQELQIISKQTKDASILNFFDHTSTQGGRDALKAMLLSPKAFRDDVIVFQELLKTIVADPNVFQVDVARAYVAAAEAYYASSIAYSMSQDVFQHWFDTFIFAWRNPSEFYLVRSGLIATFRIFKAMQVMISNIGDSQVPQLLKDDVDFLKNFLQSTGLAAILKTRDTKLSLSAIFLWDYRLRISLKKDFRRLLDCFYTLDAYQSIARTAKIHSLNFPEFVSENSTGPTFEVESIWHLLMDNAVPNSISLNNQTPICVLTGANTSGKTTFLKTAGVVIYLAHLGWPVPARTARISFVDRLFTSINLSDNMGLGHSHFYGEVIRIRDIATALSAKETCFVIIDELFRGTNQEDAFHCSKTVIDGFLLHNTSSFLVSTHLLNLIKHYEATTEICFRCFRTKIIGDDFENTFQIEDGISTEKLGQIILKQAGVAELLHS
ncbi:MutS-related protein [Dyadobacter sp. CY326]|uniref:MutS-related protein n=1 Tax=Dyadobacter sp. CY326 TaxID=2907300 RepID=UPI001F421ADE|nr:DNA mismatch repair protein MutS [Dyadobacter sp. CY326]MCE7063806.1 DNA mismatch repair protein MutS [Dyadobacter sp. CY326]